MNDMFDSKDERMGVRPDLGRHRVWIPWMLKLAGWISVLLMDHPEVL